MDFNNSRDKGNHMTEHFSAEQMKAEMEKLRAENEELKRKTERSLSLKVSEKGAVSLYGLGRFPVTLYKQQWLKVLGFVDEIRSFIDKNDSKLKVKS